MPYDTSPGLARSYPGHIRGDELSSRSWLLSLELDRRASEFRCAVALPAFLHSYVANLVIAGVRLIPLGQTDGQLAIAALEDAVLSASAQGNRAPRSTISVPRD